MTDKPTKATADTTSETEVPKEDVQQVLFTKPYQPYNQGEVATFLPAKADAIVALGVAEKVSPAKAEELRKQNIDSIASQQAAIHVRPSEEDLNARNSNPKSAAAPYYAPDARMPDSVTLTTADGDADGTAITGAEKGTGASNTAKPVPAASGAVKPKEAS